MKDNGNSGDGVVRTHYIEGAGGTRIRVDEAGAPSGRPVLFIHGISQCRLAWRRQFASRLGADLRLVAMDLRGHGESDRPGEGYGEAGVWVEEVRRVITAMDLVEPVLCGWSYGGVVIGDYLKDHGDRALGGIALVGAVSRLGEPVMPFLGDEFVATLPGLFSDDVATSVAALRTFIRLTTHADPAPAESYLALGYNCAVSPQVRLAMLRRTVNHDDVFERLTKPLMLTHGRTDRVVLPAMSRHHSELVPHAKMSYYEGVGHSPFLEDAERFNAELSAFAAAL